MKGTQAVPRSTLIFPCTPFCGGAGGIVDTYRSVQWYVQGEGCYKGWKSVLYVKIFLLLSAYGAMSNDVAGNDKEMTQNMYL